MNRRRHKPTALRRCLWWTLLAASLASGCVGGGYGGGYAGRLSVPTPPDPPPLPMRKPWPQAAEAPAVAPRQRQVTTLVTAAMPAPAILVAYAVQPGDTIFGIGRRLSVPLRSIIDANALQPPYTLRTGQTLRVPNPRKHVVSKGDTVYGIAQRYQVNLTELVRLNHIPAPFAIAPGQDLILPVPARTPRTAAAAARPMTPAPSVAAASLPAPVPQVVSPVPAPQPGPGEKSLPSSVRTAALQPPPVEPRTPAAIPTPPPRGGSTFLWPVRGRLVTAYGPKDGGFYNDGINIAAAKGTPVRAADNGVVAYVGNELRGFGNLILVKHAGGWVTAYAHNDALLVRRGDKVARGQPIAQVGNTGNVGEPQLHFEIRRGTRAVDPMGLLDPQRAALAD